MALSFSRWQASLALGTCLTFGAAGGAAFAAASHLAAPPDAARAATEQPVDSPAGVPVLASVLVDPPSSHNGPTGGFAPENGSRTHWATDSDIGSAWVADTPAAEAEVEVIRERYPNRKVKVEREVTQDAEGNYINHGSWKMWDPRGTLVAQGQFVEDARDGLWHRWHSVADSKLFQQIPYQQFPAPFVSQATFNNGQIDGTWTIYDSKQRKISQWHYKAGVRHGPSIWWYPNGKVMREANYTHGDLDGQLRQYSPTGELVVDDTYQLGRKLAKKVNYHRNGKQKKSEGVYLFAKIVDKGSDDWWNAAPSANITVGVDEKHGPWTAWYANGQLQMQGNYKHDLEVGSFVWWYPNGQKASEGSYVDGLPDGTWNWWHENGQKSSQGQYKRGELVGLWNSWDENGKLIRAEDHRSGKIRTAEQPSFP